MIMSTEDGYRFQPFKFSKVECVGTQVLHPRSGHRCVTDGANLYSFGGYNPDAVVGDLNLNEHYPLFRELWRFNLATRVWNKVETCGHSPRYLASHSAVLYGHHMLVYGGTGLPFGNRSSNYLYACDLNKCRWYFIPTWGLSPPKLYGQAIALENKSLLTVGGTTGWHYMMSIHRLNSLTFEWEELTSGTTNDSPLPRYRHEVAVDGEMVYVLGGGTNRECYELQKVPAFHIGTRTWNLVNTWPDSLGNFPAPRRCHSLAQKDKDVYICGGYDGETIFAEIWRLNLCSMRWNRIHDVMPHPVYFHSSALTKSGCMYIFGGVTNCVNTARTADVYRIWLCIPSLKEICWEAMMQMWPNLTSLSPAVLLELGIPHELVDRINSRAVYG